MNSINAKQIPLTLCLGAILVLAACGGGGDAGTAPPAPVSALPPVATSVTGKTLAPAPANLSGNVRCENLVIGAVRLDSVIVPAGASCQLDGTVMIGTLEVQQGASVVATGVSIAGNLQAEAAADVLLQGRSQIVGAIQIKRGTTARIINSVVQGDLLFEQMQGPVDTRDMEVRGNLQAFANTGGVRIENNAVRGNMQCKDNTPAPITSGNSAASFEDQCTSAGSGGSGGSGGVAMPPTLPPQGSNVVCAGLSLPAQTFQNVVVPAGASCSLTGTRLTGNLELESGARAAVADASIAGSVSADGAASLTMSGATVVTGAIQAVAVASAVIDAIEVRGDVQLMAGTGPTTLRGTRVGGNVQAEDNRGALSIEANRISGNLQCQGNTPAPSGAGNRAAQKQGQCALL